MRRIYYFILLTPLMLFILLSYFFLPKFIILNVTGDWTQTHYPNMLKLLRGDFSVFVSQTPVFYFLMLPIHWLPTPVLSTLVAVILLGSIIMFTYKMEGFHASMVTGFSLLSSFIFILYSAFIVPTLLDVMLFLLSSYFFFKDKYLESSSVLVLLMYNHSLNIVWFLILFFYSLVYEHSFLKYMGLVFILSLPVLLLYTSPAIYSGVSMLLSPPKISGDDFVYQLFGSPLVIIKSTGIALWILLPLSIYCLMRYHKLKREHLFYSLWFSAFFFFVIMNFPTLYDECRWIFLSVIPFFILSSSIINLNLQEVKNHGYNKAY